MENLAATNNAIFISTGASNVYVQTAGTMTVLGNAFSVGVSTLVVKGGSVGIWDVAPSSTARLTVLGDNVDTGKPQGSIISARFHGAEDAWRGGAISSYYTATLGLDTLAFGVAGASGGNQQNPANAAQIKMVITELGTVGIGTTSPGSALDVVSGGNTVLTMGASATWTPTWTGFSSTPTVTNGRYLRVGKIVWATWSVDTAGVSNNTAHTIALPVTAGRTITNAGYVVCVDNGGTSTTSRIDTVNASASANLYYTAAGSVWTASGDSFCGGHIIYESQ